MKKHQFPLLVAVVLLTPTAFGYGLNPELADNVFAFGFDFVADTPDQKNIFRAIMGLYLGMVALWITGIRSINYWRPAMISLIVFMLGLAAGRLLSFLVDGFPTINFVVGTAVEVLLGGWAIVVLQKYGTGARDGSVK